MSVGAAPAAIGRVAVIGDLAGHLDELTAELGRLGADPACATLPADLTVVQLGDLIHRGPDSAGVVALVDRYLTGSPGRWVQLMGNHEAQYVRTPAFTWPERLDDRSAATIRRWWEARQAQVAVALRTGTEDVLVTHAGLTVGFWRAVLGSMPEAGRVAAALNSLAGYHDEVLFAGGQMLGGGRPQGLAGPLWASAVTELLPSWRQMRLPFSQVHGHSTLVDWETGRLRGGAGVVRRTTLDHEARHETTTFDAGRIVGVDPGHGARSRTPWRAWVVHGHVTAAPASAG